MRGLLHRFQKFIEANNLIEPGSRVILAVSGGMDSVVLAHLFHQAEIKFAIAHCNFKLRGEESEGDEAFVKELAASLQVPFYTKAFDTKAYADSNKLSIQMAARALRYEWFRELLQIHHYNLIATAHHKDDAAETILLNLVKGAVMTGLQGILPKNGNLIRPLLWAEKAELRDYAGFNKIGFREDSSNREDKYQRNLIRNKVIPLLRDINPNVADSIYKASLARQGLDQWMQKQLGTLWKELGKAEGESIIISIDKLKEKAVTPAVLYAMIEDYGFSFTQVENLFHALSFPDAKVFTSAGYRMLKERKEIHMMPLDSEKQQEGIYIDEDTLEVVFHKKLFRLDTLPVNSWVSEKHLNIAQFDLEKLQFPLYLRHWQAGDSFVPFGMKGRKKVSDFLTDAHAGILEKEAQLVLLSGFDIIWLIGRRTDERYKVTADTRQVYRIILE